MNKSDSITEIAKALNKAQGDMSGAKKGSANPFFKSKYSDLNSVIDALRVPFFENGLSYSQFPINDGDRVGVETILMHISGEWLSSSLTFPTAKKDAQSGGSAITYAKRYALQAMAGIPSEDDDGNGAMPASQQVKQKSEIECSIEMIDQALATNDVDYVSGNWNTVIAKAWQYLGQDRINKLNNMGG